MSGDGVEAGGWRMYILDRLESWLLDMADCHQTCRYTRELFMETVRLLDV